MVQAMKGRKLPALSRIEISIIEEQVPELLAFDQGGLDYVALGGQHPRPGCSTTASSSPSSSGAASGTTATRSRR